MICTISSRGSPLPPGNWCEALSVTCACAATDSRVDAAATANTVDNFLIVCSSMGVFSGSGIPPRLFDTRTITKCVVARFTLAAGATKRHRPSDKFVANCVRLKDYSHYGQRASLTL